MDMNKIIKVKDDIGRLHHHVKHRLRHRFDALSPTGKTIVYGLLGLLLLFLILYALNWIRTFGQNRKGPPPIPVQTASVKNGCMPLYIPALGSVIPTESVTVKTQINGQLQQVYFKEGQDVKKGDILAQIDPRPYEAQLIQLQGQLERDQAILANARIDLDRYKNLWKEDSVSQQVLATQEALVKQYEGIIKLDEGQIEGIKLNLIYAKITSPVDGRIGLRLVDPGNFVQTADTSGLFLINTVHPITVVFSVSEDYISQIVERVKSQKCLLVEAYDRAQDKLLATGKLLTYDNQIDPSTGTVKLKAIFENKNDGLFPNQFVNVKLLIKTLENTLLIPTAGIQYGSQGNFVFLVNPDKTVSIKPIKTLATEGDNSAICGEILAEQSIVIQGADKLKEGSTVTPETEKSIQPAPANQNKKHQS